MKIADAKDAAYKSTAQAFAEAEAALASYTVDDYANRFLAQVDEYRRSLQVCTTGMCFEGRGELIEVECEGGTHDPWSSLVTVLGEML